MQRSIRNSDIALVRAWAHAVYAGRTHIANVHPTSKGWMIERVADGKLSGPYPTEKAAVRAALTTGARQ
jgi:hypothetical protein